MYGVSLGMRGETKGLSGILFGLNIVTFLPMFWFRSYLGADIGSYKSLKFVGVPNAVALLLLVWISFFTMKHEASETSLQSTLLNMVIVSDEPAVAPGSTTKEDEF